MNRLHFEVVRKPDHQLIVPVVDGVSLAVRIAAFEAAQGMDPAGGYAGLVPQHFDFGDLTTYFLGTNARQWPGAGSLWLLACDCGEVGCWPLEARVHVTESVTWSDFVQPHRPRRDYSAFGVLTFEAAAYRDAVARLVDELRATRS